MDERDDLIILTDDTTNKSKAEHYKNIKTLLGCNVSEFVVILVLSLCTFTAFVCTVFVNGTGFGFLTLVLVGILVLYSLSVNGKLN